MTAACPLPLLPLLCSQLVMTLGQAQTRQEGWAEQAWVVLRTTFITTSMAIMGTRTSSITSTMDTMLTTLLAMRTTTLWVESRVLLGH